MADHICGVSGYDPMCDEPCPACEKAAEEAVSHLRAKDINSVVMRITAMFVNGIGRVIERYPNKCISATLTMGDITDIRALLTDHSTQRDRIIALEAQLANIGKPTLPMTGVTREQELRQALADAESRAVQWRRVEDGAPEPGRYPVWCDDQMMLGDWTGRTWIVYCETSAKVTHWAPLPSGPRES